MAPLACEDWAGADGGVLTRMAGPLEGCRGRRLRPPVACRVRASFRRQHVVGSGGMRWRPTAEDKGPWSAVGIFVAGAALLTGLAGLSWPFVAGIAVVGVYVMLAPLLRWPPWHDAGRPRVSTGGIVAGHGITAGGDIDSAGPIRAGRGVRAGGRIRSGGSDAMLAAMATRRADLAERGITNPLVNKVLIRQHATPLSHGEDGCVLRAVVAGAYPPSGAELTSPIKDALQTSLAASRVDKWMTAHCGGRPGTWERVSPNSGRLATLKRDWGTIKGTGSTLKAQVTFQMPPHLMLGSCVLLIFDLIEQQADSDNDRQAARVQLSLEHVHCMLHMIAKSGVDEVAEAVFPLVYKDGVPPMYGPNYEIQFGDRTLENMVRMPSGFTRPRDARSNGWAEISTPEDSNPRDLAARNSVIRDGIEKVLRSNGYDGIEGDIAKLRLRAV